MRRVDAKMTVKRFVILAGMFAIHGYPFEVTEVWRKGGGVKDKTFARRWETVQKERRHV